MKHSVLLLLLLLAVDAGERSPGELSEDEETRDYQEYSSNEDVSDVDAGDDDRPPRHSRKMRSARPTIASRVSCTADVVLDVQCLQPETSQLVLGRVGHQT